jgi:hypothetical protein
MNCHNQVLANDPRLALVRESHATGKPIPWVQIHKTPDFVYFNHAVHVNRGVSCVHCHGRIDLMDEVHHAQPLSMGFCLDCHRDPAPNLRDPARVTDLAWQPANPHAHEAAMRQAVHDWNINSSQNCSACHR